MNISLELNYEKEMDLISFSPRENVISVPHSEWFACICASLRLKRSVLVVHEKIPAIHQIDQTKRWVAGDEWVWLAPRSLSFITEAYLLKSMTFSEFVEFLRSSK